MRYYQRFPRISTQIPALPTNLHSHMQMNEKHSSNTRKQRDEERTRRGKNQRKTDGQPSSNAEYDSGRPESDGEDFNQGGRSRSRSEATGEDF